MKITANAVSDYRIKCIAGKYLDFFKLNHTELSKIVKDVVYWGVKLNPSNSH